MPKNAIKAGAFYPPEAKSLGKIPAFGTHEANKHDEIRATKPQKHDTLELLAPTRLKYTIKYK